MVICVWLLVVDWFVLFRFVLRWVGCFVGLGLCFQILGLFVVCFDVCELIWMFSFYGFGLGLCIDLWALWLMVFCCFGGCFDLGCDTGLVVWWICLFLLFLFYWVFAWFLCFVILFCFSWFEFRLVV